jgi:hypothetical protein
MQDYCKPICFRKYACDRVRDLFGDATLEQLINPTPASVQFVAETRENILRSPQALQRVIAKCDRELENAEIVWARQIPK